MAGQVYAAPPSPALNDDQGSPRLPQRVGSPNYRVGNPYRRDQVEVRVAGDIVEISVGGRLIRTYPVKHDPDKAFANPGGKADRINAAS